MLARDPSGRPSFRRRSGSASTADLDPEVKEIRREFGSAIFPVDQELNREGLRHIVFNNAAKRRAELILHPRIRRQWSTEAKGIVTLPIFFADILLYEPAVKSCAISGRGRLFLQDSITLADGAHVA
jgi:hypothetical protein